MKESELRSIIREEILNELEGETIKNVSWESLEREYSGDGVNAQVYMNSDGTYIVIDEGRGRLFIPVDRTREPIYR